MLRPLRGVVAAVVAAGLSAGCGGSLSGDIALYRPSGSGGHEALLEGHLLRHEGCTYLHSPQIGLVLPIFPVDAQWQGGELRSGGERYSAVDLVDLAGSETKVAIADYVPEGCDTRVPAWLVSR